MKINCNLVKFDEGLDLESGAKLDSFELMAALLEPTGIGPEKFTRAPNPNTQLLFCN